MNLLRKDIPRQGRIVTCKRAKAISKKLKWLLIQYINKLYPKLKANRIIHTFLRLSQNIAKIAPPLPEGRCHAVTEGRNTEM